MIKAISSTSLSTEIEGMNTIICKCVKPLSQHVALMICNVYFDYTQILNAVLNMNMKIVFENKLEDSMTVNST